MSPTNMKNLSIKTRLILMILAPILAISLFIYFYFPAQQSTAQTSEFTQRMEEKAEMVALGAGVGLGTDQLLVIKNVFDWAKQDSALEYIVVLDKEGGKMSQYPPDKDIDFEKFSKLGEVVVDGDVLRFVKKINYANQELGSILLGANLNEVKLEVASTKKVALAISIVVLAIGFTVALLLGRFIGKRLLGLIKVANNIKSGDLNSIYNDKSSDEIGDLGQSLNEMSAALKKNQEDIENTVNEMKKVVDGINNTAEDLKAGKLNSRASLANVDGEYQRILTAFNTAIDTILEPINESIKCVDNMAQGDLTVSVRGSYLGDNARMKDALNQTLESLNTILGQVSQAVTQVAQGSGQVSDASQSLSQGATEQASSLEEISSSISEITSQTKQNAANADTANTLGSSAKSSAIHGNEKMKKMLDAMIEINQSSSQISKIIKVIDEIAFQTNLLALNAAVEAARAGVHGKGFAVVAEEVRNLAQRSAKAARETTELIEGSVKKVDTGTSIAKDTAKALEEIVDSITKVTDLVGEIAAASNEQASGIDQINQGLSQIDQVTQSNTASAEESASAAEELSNQALQLQQLLARITLRKINSFSSASEFQGNEFSNSIDSFQEKAGYGSKTRAWER